MDDATETTQIREALEPLENRIAAIEVKFSGDGIGDSVVTRAILNELRAALADLDRKLTANVEMTEPLETEINIAAQSVAAMKGVQQNKERMLILWDMLNAVQRTIKAFFVACIGGGLVWLSWLYKTSSDPGNDEITVWTSRAGLLIAFYSVIVITSKEELFITQIGNFLNTIKPRFGDKE